VAKAKVVVARLRERAEAFQDLSELDYNFPLVVLVAFSSRVVMLIVSAQQRLFTWQQF
jgi:hypothetical protein